MKSPLKTIGFIELDEAYTIEELLAKVLLEPTIQKIINMDEDNLLAEYRKEIARNTYVMARIAVDQSEEKPKLDVYDCEPHVKAEKNIQVIDVEIESVDDSSTYYVVCEEETTGMQMVFWMQNVVEYLNSNKKKEYSEINVVAVALEGTIVLPIIKDEDDVEQEKEEREQLREMIRKIKDGDEEAREKLEEEEKEIDSQLKERLKEEDFLSIMSGYFIPVTMEDAVYAILGEIEKIEERVNSFTQEEMYVFTVNVNELLLEVIIHKKELIGMPTVGMRFMGTGWLQGKVVL
ncbi:MAG: DUF3881 family protein [Cellulosilyticaceae bacterium]